MTDLYNLINDAVRVTDYAECRLGEIDHRHLDTVPSNKDVIDQIKAVNEALRLLRIRIEPRPVPLHYGQDLHDHVATVCRQSLGEPLWVALHQAGNSLPEITKFVALRDYLTPDLNTLDRSIIRAGLVALSQGGVL